MFRPTSSSIRRRTDHTQRRLSVPMLTYLLRRLLLLPPTLIGMTLIVFFVLANSPGGIGASLLSRTGDMRPEERRIREAYLNKRYGLDKSKPVQYLRWLNKVLPIGF